MLETKTAPFKFAKQGIFYFSRRVPRDLSHHYNASRIMYSLRTKSTIVAASRAQRAAQTLDEHWYHLRIRDVDPPPLPNGVSFVRQRFTHSAAN